MAKPELDGVVVLLPGILGSTLAVDGKPAWGLSAGALVRGILTRGDSIKQLELKSDSPTASILDDGVTATGLVQDIHLIPGLWKIEGYTRIRDTIQSYFSLAPDQLIEFPYDWRRDIRAPAHLLAERAREALHAYRQRTGSRDGKLILLAHSQGGLVSRYFLECLDGWRETRLLVTFGTPYQGSINPLNFLANGFKKKIGPFSLIDLTGLARSLTSLHQMMTSYACVDTGDGTLQRIADVAGIPGVDHARARAALEFHKEIEASVDAHMDDEEYRLRRYSTVPVVGRYQPTLQIAKLVGSHLEVADRYPGEAFEGDGTVPEIAATPHEYGSDPVAAYMRQRHSELQNWPAALDHVMGVIARLDIEIPRFRGPAEPFALTLDDAYDANDPITFSVRGGEDPRDVVVVVNDLDAGVERARRDVAGVTSDGAAVDMPPLAPGAYRMIADFGDGQPITDVFVVAPPEPVAANGGSSPRRPQQAVPPPPSQQQQQQQQQARPQMPSAPPPPSQQQQQGQQQQARPPSRGGRLRAAVGRIADAVTSRRERRGRGAMRNGGGVTSPEPRPAMEPAIEPTGGAASPPADALPEVSYAKIECPPAVVEHAEFICEIGLAAEAQAGMAATPIRRPDVVVDSSYVLTVQVVLTGFHAREGEALSRDLTVSVADPYPTFDLHLTGDEVADGTTAERSVVAIFSVAGRTIGIANRTVMVVNQPELVPLTRRHEPDEGVQLEPPTAEPPADLTVTITKKRGSPNELQWRFQSPHPLPVDAAPDSDIGDEPELFAQQLIESIKVHEGRPNLFQQLRGQGRAVAQALPAEFWTVLEAVHEHVQRPPVVLFLSQEPYVPWEIALTSDALTQPFDPNAAPFLGAQTVVGRWFAEDRPRRNPRPPLQPSNKVAVSAMGVVAGRYTSPTWPTLTEALAEADALNQTYGAIEVNASLTDVDRCLKGEPKLDLLHFAMHGKYTHDSVHKGLVLIDGQYLDASSIQGYDFPAPFFVFLNACQVGTGESVLGDYAGMASAFLRAGAAAVIAPLWSINDGVAKDVALRFYQALFNGASPADFFRQERASVVEGLQDSSRLAYQYFGHPSLEVTRIP